MLGEAPPPDTADPHFWPEHSQPKNLPFSTLWPESSPHPGCELPSPVWWRQCLPATQLYLPSYLSDSESWSPSDAGASSRPGIVTFPTHGRRGLPIQTASYFPPGRMLARASWPHNLPFCLYLSNTASLDLPLDAGACSPGQTTLPFKPVAQRGLPVRHGDSETSRTSAEKPPGQTALPFQTYCSTRLTRPDTVNSETSRTSARASGTDNFPFPSCGGKAYPTTLPVDCEAFRPPSKLCLSV